MKILILENSEYAVSSKTVPIVGRYYSLEDAESGSSAQNKAFHALITEFYKWMLGNNEFVLEIDNITYDLSCPDKDTLKNIFKKKYGAGFESFVYAQYDNVSNRVIIKAADTYEQIPSTVKDDKDFRLLIRGKLKSWGVYTKKQRTTLLQVTIDLMKSVGVDSKKFHEILDGMEK